MDEKRIFLARHGQTFHNAAAGESYIDADHLDGELAGDGRERAEAHVGLYPECRRVLAGLRTTIAALMDLRARSDTDVTGGVIARLRSEP